MQDLSLVYNFEKAKSNPESAPLVVMIHGYGSHENDLFELRLALGSTAHYLSLRASINLGFGGFAWYPIHFGAGGIKTYDTDAAAQSRDLVLHFIQDTKVKVCGMLWFQFGKRQKKITVLGSKAYIFFVFTNNVVH